LHIGAAAEAEGHLQRALELWPIVSDAATVAGTDHPGLLLESARAGEQAGHLEQAIDPARQATTELSGVDPVREGEAWLLLRDLYRYTYRWGDCADAAAHALAIIPETPPSKARSRALMFATMAAGLAGRYEEALSLARQCVGVARAVGVPEALVDADGALANALDWNGDHEEALAAALSGLERCRLGVSPQHDLGSYVGVVRCLESLSRCDEKRVYAERAVALARRTGFGTSRGHLLATAWIDALVLLGRWAETERVLADVADLLDPALEADLAADWGLVLVRQGRLDEARPLLERARAVLFDDKWDLDRGRIAATVVEFDAAEGRFDDAIELVGDCLDGGVDSFIPDSLLVVAGASALADHVEADRHTRADFTAKRVSAIGSGWIERLDAFRPERSQLPTWIQLAHRRIEAELERAHGRSDPQTWARLADGYEAIEFRYDEANARFRHAEALLNGHSGRSSAARSAASRDLTVARLIARDLPAALLHTKIDEFARRARLTIDTVGERHVDGSTPPVTDRPGGLTSRELDVLRLVALGRSNGQIAKELFIGTKTVSTHVSNILRKLGVSNRVEAAAIAARHRPVAS
jgi:ATP/maltotriose-dependent transcriptional regulator MalT